MSFQSESLGRGVFGYVKDGIRKTNFTVKFGSRKRRLSSENVGFQVKINVFHQKPTFSIEISLASQFMNTFTFNDHFATYRHIAALHRNKSALICVIVIVYVRCKMVFSYRASQEAWLTDGGPESLKSA